MVIGIAYRGESNWLDERLPGRIEITISRGMNVFVADLFPKTGPRADISADKGPSWANSEILNLPDGSIARVDPHHSGGAD
jgi:hypothetical protein